MQSKRWVNTVKTVNSVDSVNTVYTVDTVNTVDNASTVNAVDNLSTVNTVDNGSTENAVNCSLVQPSLVITPAGILANSGQLSNKQYYTNSFIQYYSVIKASLGKKSAV